MYNVNDYSKRPDIEDKDKLINHLKSYIFNLENNEKSYETLNKKFIKLKYE